MSGCIERVIYPDDDDEENQEIPLGLYVMRGGNVVCIGEVDDAVEIDWRSIRGAELKGTKNPL